MITADFVLSSILSHTNTPYHYPGNWGQDSRCGVRIVRFYERVTVILTEYPSDPGTSVTNRAEVIASRYHAEHLAPIDPGEIRWIEHYPPGRGVVVEETFDWIQFDYDRNARWFRHPRWRRLTAAELADLHAALLSEAH